MTALLFLALLLAPVMVQATEVYHWVDENGVPNFSQNAPPAGTEDVSVLTLDDAAPAGYDPEEDIYQVQAQAERMQALKEEMAERRQARRESEQQAEHQQTDQNNRSYDYLWPVWRRPPYRRNPRPEPPPVVEEPEENPFLIKPGNP